MLVVLQAGSAWAVETMRIAVGAEVGRVTLDGTASQCSEDSDDATFTPTSAKHVVTWSGEGLALDGRALEGTALRFRAADARSTISVAGVRVRGDVVIMKGKAQLQVVNVLPLEDYLTGVLGSEMPQSFPLEALKAQAVAARTYALNKKLEQYGQPFHLGSSVLSQVYRGLEAEDDRTRDAVEATKGLVLTWMLQPIEAYFHSSCGGRTESGLEALNRDLPYLQAVDCPCGGLASSHWKLALGATELKALGAAKGSPLQVQGRSPTGRARKVSMGARVVDAVTFRERVGYMKLKSLSFEVEKAKDGYVLEGKGFGHGAGLCQWGARVFAEKGWDYRKILSHYYPGTELQTLY
jgi:stage II sporulation protein D